MSRASYKGHIAVLDWWKQSGLENEIAQNKNDDKNAFEY